MTWVEIFWLKPLFVLQWHRSVGGDEKSREEIKGKGD